MSGLDVAALDRPTIVEVWAPSCVACRAMQPDLDATAAEFFGRADLVRVNAAEEMDTVRKLGVTATPTLIGIREGGEVFRFTGRRSRSELQELFTAVSAGAHPPTVGHRDLVLRLGTGFTLAGMGLISEPAGPLVIVGVVVAALGVWSWRGQRTWGQRT